jgi:hypothetical protein
LESTFIHITQASLQERGTFSAQLAGIYTWTSGRLFDRPFSNKQPFMETGWSLAISGLSRSSLHLCNADEINVDFLY